MINVERAWKAVFKACGRLLPPVAYFFMLLNQYLWKGEDKQEFYKTASIGRFFKRLCVPFFSSYILALGGGYYIKDFDVNLSYMVKISYPSILGFAIGLFALVVSSEKFEEIKRQSLVKARHIAIDMAYPLFVIFTMLIANHLLIYKEGESVPSALAILNVYSIMLVYDMVAAVYMYANKK